MEKTRMYASERDALLELALVQELVIKAGEELDRRSRNVKRARSVQGLLRWGAEYLLTEYMKTVPEEQLMAFRRNLAGMRYTMGTKGPNKQGHRDEWGLWLSFEDLEALSEASKEKCLTCDLCDGRERSCPLRKCFDNLGSEIEHESKGCAYRWL